MMGISTKKGDSGYTSLLRGERVLIAAIIFLLMFHNTRPRATYPSMDKHMEQMEDMHKSIEK